MPFSIGAPLAEGVRVVVAGNGIDSQPLARMSIIKSFSAALLLSIFYAIAGYAVAGIVSILSPCGPIKAGYGNVDACDLPITSYIWLQLCVPLLAMTAFLITGADKAKLRGLLSALIILIVELASSPLVPYHPFVGARLFFPNPLPATIWLMAIPPFLVLAVLSMLAVDFFVFPTQGDKLRNRAIGILLIAIGWTIFGPLSIL
jgi:hypothetical protein